MATSFLNFIFAAFEDLYIIIVQYFGTREQICG